jgi:hypothetical protein
MDSSEWTTKHFRYDHLPEHLQKVSKIFADAAAQLMVLVPDRSPERSAALHNLLLAKDAGVRAALVVTP